MAAHARRGAVLALLAVVLVANPLYVPHVTPEPSESGSGTVYDVHAVDPGNPDDHELVYRTVGEERVLAVPEFVENDYDYDEPGPAAGVLYRALDDGSATATDPGVSRTLYNAVGGHQFVANGTGLDAAFYRVTLTAADDGSEAVDVTAERVDRATVLRAVLYADAERYESLFDREQEIVDDAIEDGHGDGSDLGDLTRGTLLRNDTAYVFEHMGHVDSFGFSTRGVVGLALSALSVPVFLAALAFTALAFRRGE